MLGFSVVFTLLGAGIAAGGSMLTAYAPVYELIAGSLIMLLGLNLIFGFMPLLYREARVHARRSPAGPLGAFAIGTAFGAGWTPCIGPILASILLLAGMEGGAMAGIAYLALYSLGLGVPFLLAGAFLRHFSRFQQLLRRHTGRIQTGSGVLLTGLGALIASGRFQLFTSWLLSAGGRLEQWGLQNPVAASAAAAALLCAVGWAGVGVQLLRRRRPGLAAAGSAGVGTLLAVLELAGVLNLLVLLGGYLQFQGI